MVRLKASKYCGFFERSGIRSSLFTILITVLLLCATNLSFSQTTFFTAQSGLWGQGTTWVGGIVPGATDNAVVQTGHNIILNTGGTGTIINDLFIQLGGLVDQGALKMTINGNFVIDGAFTSNGPDLDFFGDTLAGSGSITIGASNKAFFLEADVEILTGSQIKVDGNISIDKDVTVTNFGEVTVSGEIDGGNASSSIWTNDIGSVVNAGGVFMNKGVLNASAVGNTIRYVALGNQDITTPNGSAYFDLEVTGSGTKSQQGDLTIGNTLSISAGILDCGNHNLDIGGDWVNNGDFIEGTGTVTFNGSSDQSITNPSNERYYNLTVNKPSGILFLNNRATIIETLTMSGGDIDATANTIRIGTGTGTPGTLIRTSGIVFGKFRRWITSTGTAYLFPVGIIGNYRPVNITFNDLTEGPLRIEFIPGDPGSGGLPLNEGGFDIINQYTEGMWELTPQGALSTGDYDIQLTATNFTSYSIMPVTRIITRDSGNDWKLDGSHLPAADPDLYRENLTDGISSSRTQFGIGHVNCSGITIDRIITDVSCFEGNDGAIDVTVSGGVAPYNYSWGHGPTTEVVSSLAAGNYSLRVTDDGGCIVDSIFVVSEPASLSAMIDSTSVSCPGNSDGKISITGATGGSGTYEYSINGGSSWQASGDYTGLGAGTYDIRIRDAAMPTCSAILDPAFVLETHDLIPPVAVCRNISIQLDAAGNANITGAAIDGGSADNCGIASMTANPNTFTCANVGPNSVTLTVRDVEGNENTCVATVTVEDNTAPVAICRDITIQLNASGNAFITGADIDNGSSDACGIQSLLAIPSSFTCAHVGPNNITLMVTDVNGLVNTCVATVTVEDNTAPIAICRDITVQLDSTGIASITGADIDNGSNDACGIQSLTASPNTFTCADVGLKSVTLTVTDNNGLVNTCTAMVTVENNVGPIVVCRDISIQLDGTGNASISGAEINNGSSSLCGIQSMTVNPNTFTCIDVGMVPVTLTVTDIHGNVDSCTAVAEVEDNVAPVTLCRDITIQLDATGIATITGADIDNGSHDVCGIQSLDAIPSLFTVADVGPNNVTLMATDNNGHVGLCNAVVTLEDITPPEVYCKDISVELDASGNVTISPFDVDNGSNDESGIGFMSATPDAFSCNDLGPNPVTLTVIDNNGNSNSCMSTVTVEDNLAPSHTCPGDRSEQVDGSMNFTLPDYTGLAIISDNCSAAPLVTQDPVPGTIISGVGTLQTITLRADDGNGNISQCTFDITLVEGTAPTIACPPDQTEYVDDQCQFILPDYTSLAFINRADSVFQSPLPGTVLSGSSASQIISLRAKNLAGDSAVCNFNVMLLDAIPPIIVCPSDTVVSALPGDCNVVINNISPGSGLDNCGVDEVVFRLSGSTTGTGMGDASGTPFNKGITTVWYRITDNGGNADSCSFNVTVLTTVEGPDSAYADRRNICPDDNGTITLTYTGGTSGNGVIAQWYDSPSMPASIGSGNNLIIPVPLISTAYYVRLEGDCDTSSSVSVVVTVNTFSSPPTSAFSNPDTVCAGQGSIYLSYGGGAPGSSGMAHWYTDAQFSNLIGIGNNLEVPSPLVATSYHVRFESGCDTSSSVSTTVAVLASPMPTFVLKEELACISGTSSRYIVSGLLGSTFNWRLTGGTIIADYRDSVMVDWGGIPGTYSISVTETAASGCFSNPLTVFVNVSGPNVDLGNERIICDGNNAEVIPLGNFSFQMWHDGSTGTSYRADTAELVKIQVFDQAGCTAFDSVQVIMYPSPIVNLGSDTVLCGNNSIVLDAGNPDANYLWSTGETTREIVVYQGAGDISVEVTYGGECSAIGEISILPCGGSSMLADIPNLFTPNGDGTNDTWFFYESAVFPEMVVEIYDRWGKRVYISEPGYSVPWDGRSMHGVDMPMDSYHYIIKPGEGYEEVVGTITIVR